MYVMSHHKQLPYCATGMYIYSFHIPRHQRTCAYAGYSLTARARMRPRMVGVNWNEPRPPIDRHVVLTCGRPVNDDVLARELGGVFL